jgi:hypothetical protein
LLLSRLGGSRLNGHWKSMILKSMRVIYTDGRGPLDRHRNLAVSTP